MNSSIDSVVEPALTAQVKDAEGWFHTGDVGEIDDHLRIKVIDRVKVGLAFLLSRIWHQVALY
jgi:acyl-CoA synthetase (AMP-forming)/AMP-acid ligase II